MNIHLHARTRVNLKLFGIYGWAQPTIILPSVTFFFGISSGLCKQMSGEDDEISHTLGYRYVRQEGRHQDDPWSLRTLLLQSQKSSEGQNIYDRELM